MAVSALQLKRGALSGIPNGAAGEPLFTTDQFRLYIGSSGPVNRLVGLLHTIDATAAPDANADAGDGYSEGSTWTDVTNDKSYVCVDASVGAAVWIETTQSGSGVADGDYGDITVSSSATVWMIDNDAVTTLKIADSNVTLGKIESIPDDTILANDAGGSAAPRAMDATDARALLGLSSTSNPTFASLTVDDDIYDATGWDGNFTVPTKNAVRDKIETLSSASQPLDATLTALAAADWAANALPIGTGADTLSQTSFAANRFPARASTGNLEAKTITDFALTILDDANAAAVRSTIGAGTGSGTVASSSDTSLTISGADAIIDADWLNGSPLINGHLVASVAASALTIAIKNSAGNDPSSGDPVKVISRSATAATGSLSVITLTGATSLVLASGSEMGFISSQAARIWIVGFNDGGTFRLGVVNCLVRSSSAFDIYPLRDDLIASSTAEGTGAADNAHVFYTGTAVTSKAYRILGYMDWSSGLATPGTWASGPTKIQSLQMGMSLPGQVVQSVIASDNAYASGTTVLPYDDTIPQSGEGVQVLSKAITPQAAANALRIVSNINISSSVANNFSIALFQDSTADALKAGHHVIGANNYFGQMTVQHEMLAATTSATTFKIRCGGSVAGTTYFNGQAGARKYGGVMDSFLQIEEIMA